MNEIFGFRNSERSRDRRLTYPEAISEAISEEMERNSDVLVLGEDVGGSFGGAFNITKGLAERFGDERVLNTPMPNSASQEWQTVWLLWG